MQGRGAGVPRLVKTARVPGRQPARRSACPAADSRLMRAGGWSILAPDMGTKITHLDGALFNSVRLAILRLMFTRARREYYYRELTKAVGMGQGAVQRELRALVDAGILLKLGTRRRMFYRPNPDCPIYSKAGSGDESLRTSNVCLAVRSATS